MSSVTSFLDGDPVSPTHFNSKMDALVSMISGAGGGGSLLSGTTNFIPLYESASTLTNSIMSQSGVTISVGGSLSVTSRIDVGTPNGPAATLRLPTEGSISLGVSGGNATYLARQDGSNQLLHGSQFGGGQFTTRHIFYSGSANDRFIQVEASEIVPKGGVGALGTSADIWRNLHVTNITGYGLWITKASDFFFAGFRLPHGIEPSGPQDGDLWTTTAGLYVRINGTTVGPLGAGGSGTTISGSGTTNFIPLWSGTVALGNSLLSQSGDTIGLGGHLSVTSRVVANLFSGSGASLSNLSATAITTGTVATARLGSGSANTTTFLRGDNTWAVPPGGGGGGSVTGTGTAGTLARWSTNAGEIESGSVQDSASLTTFTAPSIFSSSVTVNGLFVTAGNATFGDATSDTVVFTARVASNVESSADTYQLGTSGQPFNRVYLGGTTPGLYVGGNQVVSSRNTGWNLMAGSDLKDASAFDIDEIVVAADFDAARGALVAVARQLRALVSALSGHGAIGA